MTKKLTDWRLTTMRGCGPGCVRMDLPVYSRTLDGRLKVGHEHHPGDVVPCGAKVELPAQPAGHHLVHSEAFVVPEEDPKDLHEGDRVWFASEKLPYKVQAVSDDGRWAVCTKPFAARHTVIYSVLDLEQSLRGVDNSIGNCLGYDTPEECKSSLALIVSGEFEFSSRRKPIPLDIHRIQHNGNDPRCRAELEAGVGQA